MKKEVTNRNDHVIKLFKCDLLIFSVRDLVPISSIVYIGFRVKLHSAELDCGIENVSLKQPLSAILHLMLRKSECVIVLVIYRRILRG